MTAATQTFSTVATPIAGPISPKTRSPSRPADKIKDEVSITSGYQYNTKNSITAKSGKNKIKFDVKKENFAWIGDTGLERKMVNVMKKGSRIMITGYNQSGSQTIDHYSLIGFTKAYNTAKKSCA